MNLEQITNFLDKLTEYFNISKKNSNVLPSPAIEFLKNKNKLSESSYLNIKEKFLIIKADKSFGIEFITDRQVPNKRWLEGDVSEVDIDRELFSSWTGY